MILIRTIIICLLFCSTSFGAVSVLNSWVEGEGAITITDNSTGERLLLFMLVAEDDNSGRILDSIEIGGVKLTEFAYDTVGSAFVIHVGIYYLLDADIPNTGATVTQYWAGVPDDTAEATVILEGVDQSTPITDGAVSISGSSDDTSIIVLDHGAGDYTASSVLGSSSGRTIAWTNATEILEYTIGQSSAALAADAEGSGGSSTITATFSSALTRRILSGCNVFAAAAIEGPTVGDYVHGPLKTQLHGADGASVLSGP